MQFGAFKFLGKLFWNNSAKKHQANIFGCYRRIADINGEPAWKKSSHSKGIWWDNNRDVWAIGDITDNGTPDGIRAKADSNANCPNLIGGYDWKYYDGSSFVRAERSLGVFGEC